MRSRQCLAALAAAVALLFAAGLCLAQGDEEQVKAAMTAMQEALGKGDAKAFADLLSDSGFVAAVSMGDEVRCADKKALTDYLAQSQPPALTLADIKVDVRFTVALISAKASLPGTPAESGPAFEAAAVREMGKWKLCALMLTVADAQPDQQALQAFVDQVATFPTALKEGKVDDLKAAVDDEHFVLCLVDPSLELRLANSKAVFIGLIESVIPMVTVNESRLDVSRTVVGQRAAVVDGTWLLDIPDFGQTTSTIRAFAVKADDAWKVVAICGGPTG